MADEFAQTRGGDDLFDDEIVPVPAEEQAQPVEVSEETVAPSKPEAQPVRIDTPPRSRGGAAGGERRGRGRGKGRGRRGSRNSSQRRAEGPTSRPKSVDATSTSQPENNGVEDSTPDASGDTAEQQSNDDANSNNATLDPKASAAGADAPKVPAVRGDRSATGGIKKPKLTEEELSRRIAAAKENAAKVAAAHARAEADQASFLEREKVAEVKRKQERQNRRVMDTERERNRLRKLQALNGREWDSEKQEEPENGRSGRGRFRGMHGGVSGYVRRDFEGAQAGEQAADNSYSHHNNYRGRGRGGRGGRGRGGGRGGRPNASIDGSASEHKPASSPPVINNDSDFPALPGSDKKDDTPPTNPAVEAAKIETSISPISATGASWAEQVESARE